MIPAMNDEFAATLKRVRTEQNLTQQDLARALGVSRAAIGQWERGETAPTFANMKALAELFKFADKLIDEIPARKSNEFMFWRIMTAESTLPDNKHTVPVTHVCIGPTGAVIKTASGSIDYLVRPDILASHENAYGIAIASDAVSPRFEIGETVYVTPKDRPSVGEYAVLNLKHIAQEENIAIIRKIIADTGEVLQVEKPKDRNVNLIRREDIVSSHRIVPWNELLMIPAGLREGNKES